MTNLIVYIDGTSQCFKPDGIQSINLYDGQLYQMVVNPQNAKGILEEPNILKVFHDAIDMIAYLKSIGIHVVNYTDTMMMAQLLEGNCSEQYTLTSVVRRYVKQDPLHETQHQRNAVRQVKILAQLYCRLQQLIESRRLSEVYYREKASLPALVEVTMNGLTFDYDGWSKELQKMQVEADDLQNEIQHEVCVNDLNLHSTQQLQHVLKRLGVKVAGVSDDELAKVEHLHSVIQKIRKWKKLQQRLVTFGEKFRVKIGEDGRVRGQWQQIGTATGRMSCSQPPLQAMPRQSRPYFTAAPGYSFIVADYAAIELRILAYITQEGNLLKAFHNKADPHAITAASIFNVLEGNVSEEQREIAKVINFGMVYGMSSFGLSRQLTKSLHREVTLEEAETYRRNYFKLYPEVLAYQDRMLLTDYISTLGGREFGLVMPSLPSGSVKRYNYPIQSAAADGLKEALILLMKRKPSKYKLVNLIHDEIILEVPENEAEQAVQMLRKAMIEGMNRITPSIPIEINYFISDKWERRMINE